MSRTIPAGMRRERLCCAQRLLKGEVERRRWPRRVALDPRDVRPRSCQHDAGPVGLALHLGEDGMRPLFPRQLDQDVGALRNGKRKALQRDRPDRCAIYRDERAPQAAEIDPVVGRGTAVDQA